MRYKCLLCGRDKFSHPQPHRCFIGYIKRFKRAARIRGLSTIWKDVTNETPGVDRLPTKKKEKEMNE